MPTEITLQIVLVFLFFSIVFGFGFAIGQWLWGVLIGAVRRGP